MNQRFFQLILAVLTAFSIGNAMAEEHQHPHHAFAKDVDVFHKILAPLWHVEPGRQRSRNACAKGNEMEQAARDIRSADAAPLLAAIGVFKARCKAGSDQADAALAEVHTAFHQLIDQNPAAAR